MHVCEFFRLTSRGHFFSTRDVSEPRQTRGAGEPGRVQIFQLIDILIFILRFMHVCLSFPRCRYCYVFTLGSFKRILALCWPISWWFWRRIGPYGRVSRWLWAWAEDIKEKGKCFQFLGNTSAVSLILAHCNVESIPILSIEIHCLN